MVVWPGNRGRARCGAACDSLFRDGVQNAYAIIHVLNEASLRASGRYGFAKVAELRHPPLFGPRHVTETGQSESRLWANAPSFRFDGSSVQLPQSHLYRIRTSDNY